MRNVFLIVSILCLGLLSAATTLKAKQESTGGLQIVEAKLGKDVKERMLADEDSTFEKNSKVFLWMKISGGSSDQITVTWKNGDYSHNTTLTVGGNPWRTWASKSVTKTGNWTVSVTDASGKVLTEVNFKVH